MATWKLKDCPRCEGDTYIDRDIDGWYQQCLMCAYRLELKASPTQKALSTSNSPVTPSSNTVDDIVEVKEAILNTQSQPLPKVYIP